MRLAKRLEARIPISKNRASAHQHRKENLTQHKGPDVIAGALRLDRVCHSIYHSTLFTKTQVLLKSAPPRIRTGNLLVLSELPLPLG